MPRAALVILMLFAVHHGTAKPYSYHFTPQSVIYLKGSSNVHPFQCFATEQLPPGNFVATQLNDGKNFVLSNACLLVKVKSIDCHNNLITHDLFKSLMGSIYPYITIEFKSAALLAMQPDGDSKYLVEMAMTLTNVTKTQHVEMFVQRVGDALYRIVGDYTIKLSSYNIKRPSALMGLIVVNDDIHVVFDVTAHINSLSPSYP